LSSSQGRASLDRAGSAAWAMSWFRVVSRTSPGTFTSGLSQD
jgi:hypothetical protein